MKRIGLVLILLISLASQSHTVEAGSNIDLQPAGVVVVSAVSGPDVTTTGSQWSEIPKMKTRIAMPYPGDIFVNFCAEMNTASPGLVWVRITDNGTPFSPSDVVFANQVVNNSHCFTFVKQNASSGFHVLRAEWTTNSNSVTATAGDRTMTVTFASSEAEEITLLGMAAPSGPDITVPAAWTTISGLGGTINLPYGSDLAITISAETENFGSNRLFVRALVDNEPASASDAVLAAGGLIGSRAYVFVMNGVQDGTHTIQLQYLCDSANQCAVGDRTMTVIATSLGIPRQVTGAFNAAPSGGWKTTTNTNWEDMPDTTTDFYNPSEADLAVQLTASIWLDNPGRIFVRALLDNTPIHPSDVGFASGGWTGSQAFTFVMQNVSRGYHTIRLQWGVDSGTAYLGDRTTAVWGFASQHPLLVVAMESNRGQAGYAFGGLFPDSVVTTSGGIRSFKPYVRDRLFNVSPSVAGYFIENSDGNYYLADGGLRGPYLKQYDEYYYRNSIPDPFTAMQTEALQKVDQDNYDFALYDRNGDGMITSKELVTLVVFYQDSADGFVRSIPNYTTNDGVTLDNSIFPHVYLPDFQQTDQIGVLAHELAHVLIDAGDMYENVWDPTAPGPYSLMDQHSAYPHLDPWHKLHAKNWFDPRLANFDGYEVLTAVENVPDIYKLADPSRPGEYFLVENRQKIGYDAMLPDTGLAIWHINESATDPARNGVMMEPACGPTNPLQWSNYLYDGSGSPWGRDFWWGSTGNNSRWLDGGDSRMGVWAIPASAEDMIVFLDVPGPGILVDVLPDTLILTAGQEAALQIRLVNTGASPDTFTMTSSLDASWIKWSANPVSLNSYQEKIITLNVKVPASTPNGRIWFTITGTGAALPYVTTTHPTITLDVTDVTSGLMIFLPNVMK